MIRLNKTLFFNERLVVMTQGGTMIPRDPICLSKIPKAHQIPVLLAAFLAVGSFFAIARLKPITTGALALILGSALTVKIMENMLEMQECSIAAARQKFYESKSICLLPAIAKVLPGTMPTFAKFIQTGRCTLEHQEEWKLCLCQDLPANNTPCSPIQEKWEEKTKEQIYQQVILPQCRGSYSRAPF